MPGHEPSYFGLQIRINRTQQPINFWMSVAFKSNELVTDFTWKIRLKIFLSIKSVFHYLKSATFLINLLKCAISPVSSSVTPTLCMSSFTTSTNILCDPCLIFFPSSSAFSILCPNISTLSPLHMSKCCLPCLCNLTCSFFTLIKHNITTNCPILCCQNSPDPGSIHQNLAGVLEYPALKC